MQSTIFGARTSLLQRVTCPGDAWLAGQRHTMRWPIWGGDRGMCLTACGRCAIAPGYGSVNINPEA